jgi:hypothetical protein
MRRSLSGLHHFSRHHYDGFFIRRLLFQKMFLEEQDGGVELKVGIGFFGEAVAFVFGEERTRQTFSQKSPRAAI